LDHTSQIITDIDPPEETELSRILEKKDKKRLKKNKNKTKKRTKSM